MLSMAADLRTLTIVGFDSLDSAAFVPLTWLSGGPRYSIVVAAILVDMVTTTLENSEIGSVLVGPRDAAFVSVDVFPAAALALQVVTSDAAAFA